MTTLADISNRVLSYMYGFSQEQQQWSYLSNSINSSDTSWTVNDATQVSRGLIEIDGTELCLVQTVNHIGANIVTIQPFGRGWQGSTATSHAVNARIENNPIFPYIRVREAINDTIRSVYPDLFAVATTKITKVSVQYQYLMPADADEVLSVKYQVIGPSKIYPFMRRYRFDGQADTTDFVGGKSIELLEEVTPGREIFVTYRKQPSELVNPTDDFTAVTGLPAGCQDVIVYGACMKLIPALELPRLILNATEASERAASVPPSSASKVSSYFGKLYTDRLNNEKKTLEDKYPIRSHFDA